MATLHEPHPTGGVRPDIDPTVRAVVAGFLAEAEPAPPPPLFERGRDAIRRHVATELWRLDPRLLDAVGLVQGPEPPPALLDAGLALISAHRGTAPTASVVVTGRFETAGVLAPVVAVAAAGADGPPRLTVQEPGGRVAATFERRGRHELAVSLRCPEARPAELVSVAWQVGEGPIDRLVTPLASSDDGAFVRYELHVAGGVDGPVAASNPELVGAGAVTAEQLERALATPMLGAAVRAWREQLARGGLTVPVAEGVRAALARYDESG